MGERRFLKSRIEKIRDVPYYTEGPVIDGEGMVYFTTLAGRSIMKWDPFKDEVSDWAYSDCPNGQAVLPSGDHLLCDSAAAAIRRFNRDGQLVKDEITALCAGEKVAVPNDLVTDDRGVIYFTDSIRHEGKVFFFRPEGNQGLIARDLDYPNGLALSADGRRLYVAESYRNRVLVMDIEGYEHGELNAKVLAHLPGRESGKPEDNLPDGIATDEEGNLWVAHYGMGQLQVVSPCGAVLGTVETGMPLTSNVVFINKDQLIVTGGYGEPGPGALLRITILNH